MELRIDFHTGLTVHDGDGNPGFALRASETVTIRAGQQDPTAPGVLRARIIAAVDAVLDQMHEGGAGLPPPLVQPAGLVLPEGRA
jgi:hypothetical protein